MYSVTARQIDWADEFENENAKGTWDVSCPFCKGEGQRPDARESWRRETPDDRAEICKYLGIEVTTADDPPEEALAIAEDDLRDYFTLVQVTECEECTDGYYEMLWNTVWKIDKTVSNAERRNADDFSGGVLVVYDPDGEAYLALGGCGMDMTPHLCAAWIALGFQWLPLEWIESLARNRGYLASCLGHEKAAKVKKVIERTITMARGELDNLAKAFEMEPEKIHAVVYVADYDDGGRRIKVEGSRSEATANMIYRRMLKEVGCPVSDYDEADEEYKDNVTYHLSEDDYMGVHTFSLDEDHTGPADPEIVRCVVHIHRLEDRGPMNEPISIAVFRTEPSAKAHYDELIEQSDGSDGDITEIFAARLEG